MNPSVLLLNMLIADTHTKPSDVITLLLSEEINCWFSWMHIHGILSYCRLNRCGS